MNPSKEKHDSVKLHEFSQHWQPVENVSHKVWDLAIQLETLASQFGGLSSQQIDPKNSHEQIYGTRAHCHNLSYADHPQVHQEANILKKRVWFQKEVIVVDWIMLLETPPQCR